MIPRYTKYTKYGKAIDSSKTFRGNISSLAKLETYSRKILHLIGKLTIKIYNEEGLICETLFYPSLIEKPPHD